MFRGILLLGIFLVVETTLSCVLRTNVICADGSVYSLVL